MYQRINRNSRGQFMRSRERWVHKSAIPTIHRVKGDDGVVTDKVTWAKHTYVRVA